MRLLPRTVRRTWLLAAAAWLGLSLAAWYALPPRPRAVIAEAATHWPRAFSSDGRWLVTEGYDTDEPVQADVRIWNAATGQPTPNLPRLPNNANAVFSPDGRWLFLCDPSAVAAEANSLWDLSSYR